MKNSLFIRSRKEVAYQNMPSCYDVLNEVLAMGFVVFIIFLMTPQIAMSSDRVMTLKSEAVMRDSKLFLKDIIVSDETDATLISQYGQVQIIGEGEDDVHRVDRSRLHNALLKAGADLSEIAFKMSQSVIIERGMGINLDAEKISQIQRTIEKNYKVPSTSIKIGNARILPKIPEEEVNYFRFDAIHPMDLSRLKSSSFRVSIRGDDGLSHIYTLYLPLTIETKVLISNRDFIEGDILSKEDYTETTKTLEALHEPILTANDFKDESPKAMTNIHKDEILLSRMIKPAVVVKAGTSVTLSYKTAVLNVHTQGKMKDEGVVGDIVRVENIDSQQVVTGRLISKDIVEVASAK